MKRLSTLLALLALLGPPASSAAGPAAATPRLGNILGTIIIAKLHVRALIREGTDAAELNRGPSHYPSTALPGQGETIAIAGHRTTYGAWFRHIDQLTPGDEIDILLQPKFGGGTHRYRTTGHRIVAWNAGRTLLQNNHSERLILSACHPPGSDAYRYIVYAYPIH
jgi:sortase A